MIDISQAKIGMIVYYKHPSMFYVKKAMISNLYGLPETISLKFAGCAYAEECLREHIYCKHDDNCPEVHDPVNHPQHYNSHPAGIECIDIVEHMSFNIGNAIKYLWRSDHKGATLEDLEKAIWYIRREIDRKKQDLNPL